MITDVKQESADVLRLRRAAQDLEDAASRAFDAIADLDDEDDDGRETWIQSITRAVVELHDQTHIGLARYCEHEACRIVSTDTP